MRERLPDERNGFTHHFTINGVDGYLTVGLYDDDRIGEIFIKFAKTGGRECALLDAWATMVSIAIQHGVPLGDICAKFRGYRFEPQGVTSHQSIRFAASPIDYISQYLMLRFGIADE